MKEDDLDPLNYIGGIWTQFTSIRRFIPSVEMGTLVHITFHSEIWSGFRISFYISDASFSAGREVFSIHDTSFEVIPYYSFQKYDLDVDSSQHLFFWGTKQFVRRLASPSCKTST